MVLTGPRDKKPRCFWKLRQCNGQEEDVCGVQTMTGLDWICVGLVVISMLFVGVCDRR